MCILFISINQFSGYPLVLLANRDEFHKRPTSSLDYWKDSPSILAGRDEKEGGTWMGFANGRIAALTNFRDLSLHKEGRLSRGFLVKDFLEKKITTEEYLSHLKSSRENYNPYNLLWGELSQLYVYNNVSNEASVLKNGIYGLSNAFLDTPWPKIQRGKEKLQKLSESPSPQIEDFFQIMRDETKAPDNLLPHTGVGLEKERLLSSLFISDPVYGTRSTALFRISEKKEFEFVERSFDSHSRLVGTQTFQGNLQFT